MTPAKPEPPLNPLERRLIAAGLRDFTDPTLATPPGAEVEVIIRRYISAQRVARHQARSDAARETLAHCIGTLEALQRELAALRAKATP